MILAPAAAEVNFPRAPGLALETLARLADWADAAGNLAECQAIEGAWEAVAADDAEYDAWLDAHADLLAEEAACAAA